MRLNQFALACVLAAVPALHAGVLTFGDMDCLNQGCYGSANPTDGATLEGLAPGAVTLANTAFFHTYPFTPESGEFPGTDRIYVGSVFTGSGHDGYSGSDPTLGPQVVTLDYSSLVPSGASILTFTLGIAADDFQFPSIGNPFTATVNGVAVDALSARLNAFDQSGPYVQFFTIGIDPSMLTSNHVLTLSIDEGGDGGDGWAVDFFTAGVTTTATPEPATLALMAAGLALALIRRKKRA